MTESKPSRVHLLDELRGFIIIFVVVYHLLFDLTVLFPAGMDDWMFDPWMNNLRDGFVAVLVLISGISCLYSHSNLRRGFKTFAFGMVFTVVTYLFMPSELILFGILHFFGCCMMLYALLEKPISQVPVWLGAGVCILLFFLTKDIYYGKIGLFGYTVNMPAFFYGKPLLFPLGFASAGITSSDYYPMMPWAFMFFAGAFLGRIIRKGKAPVWFYSSHLPWLAKIGRHTLLIYLVHQPILYSILYLWFMILSR